MSTTQVEGRNAAAAANNSQSSVDEKFDVEKDAHLVPAVVLADPAFDDPNLDKDAVVLEDDSPYPEVRSAVANTDDPDMPTSTIRSWVIGIIWAILIPVR
jgi:hypothetical protein